MDIYALSSKYLLLCPADSPLCDAGEKSLGVWKEHVLSSFSDVTHIDLLCIDRVEVKINSDYINYQ